MCRRSLRCCPLKPKDMVSTWMPLAPMTRDIFVCTKAVRPRCEATSKKGEVGREHPDLLGLVAQNLAPGGVVYFSTNFRRFHLAEEPLAKLYTIREITRQTIPEDFRNERIHRAWRMVKIG